MAPRRTPRQIVFDSWSEKKDFMPEVCHLVASFGGAFMHPNEAQVRKGRTITPTSVPWPDLTIWFPDSFTWPSSSDQFELQPPNLHLVELKSHDNPKPRGGQPELFASLRSAGVEVHVWEARYLDELIPETLASWSGRLWDRSLYVPRAPRLRAQLKNAA